MVFCHGWKSVLDVKDSLEEWTDFLGPRETPETQRPISEGNRNIIQVDFILDSSIHLSTHPFISTGL